METASKKHLPFPTRQLFILCVCRFAEPVCFHPIPLCLLYGLPWGYLSDRIGRRPVILIGMTGTIISILLFGLSHSYTWALTSRSLCGLLNGNIGALKSMVAELTVDHSSNQRARAFSLLPLMYGLGSIFGPILGGFLTHPVEKYPSVFGGRGWITTLLEANPYFLPCFTGACLCTVGLVFGVFFLEETLGTKSRDSDNEDESEEGGEVAERQPLMSGITPSGAGVPEYNTFPVLSTCPPPSISTSSTPTLQSSPLSSRAPSPSPTPTLDTTTITVTAFRSKPKSKPSKPTLRSVLTRPVLIIITAYILVCFQTVMYDGLYSIWAATPPSEGGLGFTSNDIGISLSAAGVMTLVMQLLLWPALQRRWGTLAVFRFALAVYIPLYFSQGFLRHLHVPYVWAGLMVCLAGKTMCSVIVFTSSMILVSDSASSLSTLGTINGFAQCMASGMRAIGPALCGTLYSWALDEEEFPWIVRVHFMLGFLSLVAVGTWWWSLSNAENLRSSWGLERRGRVWRMTTMCRYRMLEQCRPGCESGGRGLLLVKIAVVLKEFVTYSFLARLLFPFSV